MPPMKPESRQSDSPCTGTLSLGQLARRWHTTGKEIRRLLGAQQLNFVQVRGRFRIPLDEIVRYEKRQSGAS